MTRFPIAYDNMSAMVLAYVLLRSSSPHSTTVVDGVPGKQAGDISGVGRPASVRLMAMVPPYGRRGDEHRPDHSFEFIAASAVGVATA